MTRAKFECTHVYQNDDGSQVKLQAVTNGSDENEQFFKWTPSGSIEMGIVNPNVKFEQGKFYYVDFIESE